MDGIDKNGAQRLKSFVERIERLEEEKAALGDDIKAVYAELKAAGFTPKIVRAVVKLRKMDSSDREEQAELLGLYCEAVGFDYTPLGRAARGLGKGDE